jgi:hypothetical protein
MISALKSARQGQIRLFTIYLMTTRVSTHFFCIKTQITTKPGFQPQQMNMNSSNPIQLSDINSRQNAFNRDRNTQEFGA